jgi:hypothetical protein
MAFESIEQSNQMQTIDHQNQMQDIVFQTGDNKIKQTDIWLYITNEII